MTSVARVRCGPDSRTHEELRGRASQAATALAALGVGASDRVALMMRNDLRFLEISMAVGMLGGIPVPVNWHWKHDELRHLLVDSSTRVVFCNSDFVQSLEEVLPPGCLLIEVGTSADLAGAQGLVAPVPRTGRYPDFEDWIGKRSLWVGEPVAAPMSMIYTSGTTGRPKGVLREPVSPERSRAVAAHLFTTLGLEPGMRTLIPAPMYHTAPNAQALMCVAAGLDVTLMPRFDAESFLSIVQEFGIAHAQMVPTMFVRLLQLRSDVRDSYDVSSLRAVVHAAAPCPVEVKNAMIDWFGPVLREYYGGTESGAVVACSSKEWLDHPGTVGRPVADGAVRIFQGDAPIDEPGRSGTIYVRPPSMWPDFTYLGDPDKRRDVERDGFFCLGDIGYLDDDGYLYLVDRANDMVISGGVNIYPAEIEACLLTLTGVRDVAVFGVPDDAFGEAIAAHVDTDPVAELTEADIRAYVRSHLAGYKVPKLVVIDRELPREDSGKLFKRLLRARYWADTPHPPGQGK